MLDTHTAAGLFVLSGRTGCPDCTGDSVGDKRILLVVYQNPSAKKVIAFNL